MAQKTNTELQTYSLSLFILSFFSSGKISFGGLKCVFLGGGDVLFGGWSCAFLGGGDVSNLGGGDVLG